jgi:hypothetical protein
MEKIFCSRCGKECVSDGFGTGYGENSKTHEKFCYDCCGVLDYKALEDMKVGERTAYYLTCDKKTLRWEHYPRPVTSVNWSVQNWCGTMKINVYCKEGFHNIARVRRDVYFSYKGHRFWGTQYGNDSEICYIKRIKDSN